MASASVFLSPLREGYLEAIRQGFTFIGIGNKIPRAVPVVIKPNLTFPDFRPGVMTNIACIEDLIIALKDFTADITVVESDAGGYNKFKMEEVFQKIGLIAIAKRYGAKLLNLSHQPSRVVQLACGRRQVSLSLPLLFLDQSPFLITLPVPKVHYLSRVSLALKNQWGCLPDPRERLSLHPCFNWLIWEVNRTLKPSLVVLDGRFALNRNGPLRGIVEETNWLMMADDIVTADTLACRIMGIDPRRIPHLQHIFEKHVAPDLEGIRSNADPMDFAGPRFYLRRSVWDYPGYWCFRSSLLNYLAFRSPLAGMLHRMLYLFRRPFYDYAYHRSRFSDEEWRGKTTRATKIPQSTK